MPLSDDLSATPTSLSPELIGDWNRVIRGILSHAASTGPDLNRVLATCPDFALGQAIRGISCLLLGRAEMVEIARQAYAAALTGELGALQAPGKTTFLPYLGGERTPVNSASIRGAFTGLEHVTDRAAGTRAVLEGDRGLLDV